MELTYSQYLALSHISYKHFKAYTRKASALIAFCKEIHLEIPDYNFKLLNVLQNSNGFSILTGMCQKKL